RAALRSRQAAHGDDLVALSLRLPDRRQSLSDARRRESDRARVLRPRLQRSGSRPGSDRLAHCHPAAIHCLSLDVPPAERPGRQLDPESPRAGRQPGADGQADLPAQRDGELMTDPDRIADDALPAWQRADLVLSLIIFAAVAAYIARQPWGLQAA